MNIFLIYQYKQQDSTISSNVELSKSYNPNDDVIFKNNVVDNLSIRISRLSCFFIDCFYFYKSLIR